jgi:signal transduction histidine kinase
MKTWPLRAKLVAGFALATGVALLTLVLVAAVIVYREEISELDRRLAADSAQLFDQLRADGDWTGAERTARLLEANNDVYGFAVRGLRGIEHSVPAALGSPSISWPPAGGHGETKLGNTRLRLASFVRGNQVMLIATDLAPASENVRELVAACLCALPVVLVVVAAGSWWMAGLALSPIARITKAAGSITAARLDARLPVPSADDEIGRHIRVLNAMFDRLQASFGQATRFSADASHELRTPITILRGELEEALRAGGWNDGQEALLISLLEQTDRLQKISENLLLLARFDSGRIPLSKEPFDLGGLLAEAAEDAEMLASPAGLEIRCNLAPTLKIDGDPLLIRRALFNLIDNAVRYNRPGGWIRLTLRREDTQALFGIANTGTGIPRNRQADLFQRFFRAAQDRSRSTGGSGLGLSLCREIALAHGGSLTLSRSEDDYTEFLLRLPAH